MRASRTDGIAARWNGIRAWRGGALGALTAGGLALGCGSADTGPAEKAGPAPPAVPISGMYEVEGVTIELQGGAKREISGSVILAEEGGHYTATFSLRTRYPNPDTVAEVIGKGSGRVEGRTLTGTAETQLVVASVPGVDTGFAFVPRVVGARLVSSSVASVARDGTVSIQIESQPAEGEDYLPTRTTLTGKRVGPAGLGDLAGGPESD